jgi:hypothetical protein
MMAFPHAVVLMLTSYLLVMGYLAAGLRMLRRPSEQADRPEGRGVRVDAGTAEDGWLGLVRTVAGTALGGYLLLMAVVVGYYRGVARLGGHFLASAFTGCAALIGVALPVFFLASWLTVGRRGKDSGTGGQRNG